MTLLGLADAELALHVILVYMADFVDEQQRLAQEDNQGQGYKTVTHSRLHDPHFNKRVWEIGNGK